MRQGVLLALVGAAVFVGVGIATLPASLVTSRLPPEVLLAGVGGSVWSGGACQLTVRGIPMGALAWRAQPLSLLEGRLTYAVALERPDGYVRGLVSATRQGALSAEGITLELPLTALSPNVTADAWRGALAGTVRKARVEGGWPVDVVGTFRMSGLRPPGADFTIGDFELDFDAGASTPTRLVGRVRDVDAPLLVRAQLQIRRDRSYTLQGEVTPEPGARPEIANTVAFLGTGDAAGRREFTITGTF